MKKLTIATVCALLLVAGAAYATAPSGLSSSLLARGAGGEFKLRDHSMSLKVKAAEPTDVAVVRATLAPGGYTGWHGHPGPSIVIVKTGTIAVYEPVGDQCTVRTYGPGKAFIHSEDAHNFVNPADPADPAAVTAEFYVTYFVPEGAAPLLRDEAVPAACA